MVWHTTVNEILIFSSHQTVIYSIKNRIQCLFAKKTFKQLNLTPVVDFRKYRIGWQSERIARWCMLPVMTICSQTRCEYLFKMGYTFPDGNGQKQKKISPISLLNPGEKVNFSWMVYSGMLKDIHLCPRHSKSEP